MKVELRQLVGQLDAFLGSQVQMVGDPRRHVDLHSVAVVDQVDLFPRGVVERQRQVGHAVVLGLPLERQVDRRLALGGAALVAGNVEFAPLRRAQLCCSLHEQKKE